jgi:hypothetical protein
VINYGGFNYVAQGNGTMLLAQQAGDASTDIGPSAGQPYQVPPGYESYGAGTLINYGGLDYVIQGDGTMLLAQQADDDSADSGPSAGQPYQVPLGYEGYGAGTVVTYRDSNYVIQGDGTMLLAGEPGVGTVGDSFGYSSNYGPWGGSYLSLSGQWVTRPSAGGNSTRPAGPGGGGRRPSGRVPGRPNRPGVRPTYLTGPGARPGIQPGIRGGGPLFRPNIPYRRGGQSLSGQSNYYRGGGARVGGGGARFGGGGFRSGGGGARFGGGGARGGGRRR